jgi:hypothetical protein
LALPDAFGQDYYHGPAAGRLSLGRTTSAWSSRACFFVRVSPQGQVSIPEAIERSVQLYEALDKKDDEAKWRKELGARKSQETDSKK